MAKTYSNPEDHKYNVVEDMGRLNEAQRELFDCLDRIKVSTGVPKQKIELLKSEISGAMDSSFGKSNKPVSISDDDLRRAVGLLMDMAKGKKDLLLFQRLGHNTIIEKFSNVTIVIE